MHNVQLQRVLQPALQLLADCIGAEQVAVEAGAVALHKQRPPLPYAREEGLQIQAGREPVLQQCAAIAQPHAAGRLRLCRRSTMAVTFGVTQVSQRRHGDMAHPPQAACSA